MNCEAKWQPPSCTKDWGGGGKDRFWKKLTWMQRKEAADTVNIYLHQVISQYKELNSYI